MKKGITLVETLIVIAIIGIMLGVVTPSLSNYLPGIQLNGTTRTLTSYLREAQEKAITEQNQYVIRFFPTATPVNYQMIRIYYNSEELPEEELIRTVSLPSKETLTLDPGISDNEIAFSPDGGPSSSGNITLGLNGAQKIINVSPAGFIKIQ
ncbi:hypothetical protein A2V71_01720 [Candidatus Berkelbacteria bacterium RBG_13_40_8]|uniref:General secretion pathway GspH domain-containing protein n=1 Tax=Candidatus Berkelbacteria bacterium RBG_13_40_8 TaxID=1797467 RepID=A0A1F5DQ06_9BACT|nr:MAG: hypothetical protein A2V71_01720 [Candidatus Berkelbacteria bacterium RBG_13_40_8]